MRLISCDVGFFGAVRKDVGVRACTAWTLVGLLWPRAPAYVRASAVFQRVEPFCNGMAQFFAMSFHSVQVVIFFPRKVCKRKSLFL